MGRTPFLAPWNFRLGLGLLCSLRLLVAAVGMVVALTAGVVVAILFVLTELASAVERCVCDGNCMEGMDQKILACPYLQHINIRIK